MLRSTVAILLFVVACSSKSAMPPKGMVWKDMDLSQREAYMKEIVMPKAKEVFSAFDPKYESLTCKTCHGPGADDGSFEMPNPKLRPLPSTPEAFMDLVGRDPEVGRYTPFMAGKVQPMMGELLHVAVFDPKTGAGEFSCGNCHTLVDASGKIVAPEHHDHDHDHHDH